MRPMIVVGGPSGAGKDTLICAALARRPLYDHYVVNHRPDAAFAEFSVIDPIVASLPA